MTKILLAQYKAPPKGATFALVWDAETSTLQGCGASLEGKISCEPEFAQQVLDLMRNPPIFNNFGSAAFYGSDIRADFPHGKIVVKSQQGGILLYLENKEGSFTVSFPTGLLADLRRRSVDIPM